VFEQVGKVESGRMTMNKLRRAIRRILGAWSHWSVYTHEFIDELEALFEGRPYVAPSKEQVIVEADDAEIDGDALEDEIHCIITNKNDQAVKPTKPQTSDDSTISNKTKGGWKDVKPTASSQAVEAAVEDIVDVSHLIEESLDGEPLNDEELEGVVLLS